MSGAERHRQLSLHEDDKQPNLLPTLNTKIRISYDLETHHMATSISVPDYRISFSSLFPGTRNAISGDRPGSGPGPVDYPSLFVFSNNLIPLLDSTITHYTCPTS